MYCEHFGLHQVPFSITPQTGYFYAGAGRGQLLDDLMGAIEEAPGIIEVSGNKGTGKTMFCHMIGEHLPDHHVLIHLSSPGTDVAALLAMVAESLQARPYDDPAVMRRIERRLSALHASGRRVLLLVDEAQTLPSATLEMIGILSGLEIGGRKIVQVVLCGSPELDRMLARRALRVVQRRIARHFTLAPLNPDQIGEYLRFRLSQAGYTGSDLFVPPLTDLIWQASKGSYIHINLIADKALLAAFADNSQQPTEAHVKAAIGDTRLPHSPVPRRPLLIGLAGVASVAIIAGSIMAIRHGGPSGSVQEDATPASGPASMAAPANAAPPRPVAASRATAPLPAPATSAPAVTDLQRFEPVSGQLGPGARALLAESHANLDSIADDQWFLQLRAVPVANAARLETFLTNAAKSTDMSQMRLFVFMEDPRQTVGVVYGVYPSSQAAYAELARLPAWIRGGGAYARPYKVLQQEKQKAAASAAASGSLPR